MKLFYAPPSPYARKARIAARELDLMDRIEEIAVNPFKNDGRLLAANPAGLVPTMIMDDGAPLIDSPLICQYLDSVNPDPRLIPDEGAARWRVLHHAALGDVIMDFAVDAVYELRRTDGPPSQATLDRKKDRIGRCLADLPEPSATNMNALTLGDITAACALAYLDFRLPDFDWRGSRPDLAGWRETMEARPSFQQTKPAEHLN